MFEKLDKAYAELKRIRAKRIEWENKEKAQEKKCAELEKTCIHEIMVSEELTPKQLAELIAYAKNNLPGDKPVSEIVNTKKEEEFDETEE
ncbi:MAG: DUF4315 family protein [Pseudobutyrivibrio sp.]|nr:DUF4315 family protein [Pseudobutyrivibrio sp.]